MTPREIARREDVRAQAAMWRRFNRPLTAEMVPLLLAFGCGVGAIVLMAWW